MRQIALKILFLGASVFVMNQVYIHTSYTSFVYDEADQIFQIEKVKNADVLYVSASSNFSQHPLEEEPRKLSQYLSDFYPSLLFEAINVPASHAGTHATLLNDIPETNLIQTVICVINLRSFGPDWQNSPLETPLNKQMVMHQDAPPLLNRLLVSLNAYDHKSIKERIADRSDLWEQSKLPFPSPRSNVNEWCALEKWGDWQDPKRQLADQYIKQYAFVIDETNPRVKDLDQIIALAKSRQWNLVFSILPENMEEARMLVGDELIQLIESNREWLTQRYAQDAMVVDNLELLPSKRFADKDFPTEHYDELGRKTAAGNLGFAIRPLYPDRYQNAPWATNMILNDNRRSTTIN